jgi:hypothetical protein
MGVRVCSQTSAVPIQNGPGKVYRWYWTALDYRTGMIVYSKIIGNGLPLSNNYAS